MTEKEKMLSGQPYDSRDPELIARYQQARTLLQDYAQLDSHELERRTEILRALLGRCGEGVWIEAPFYCDYGEQIFIGDRTFIHTQGIFLDSNTIHIGQDVLIGPNVQIYTATHPLEARERIRPFSADAGSGPYVTFSRPVSIGDRCWIGGSTVILPGVKIGAETTIGAGSVVSRSIPAGVLALGNPCRVVRSL